MGRFLVQYVGDLDLPVPETAVEVADDVSYIRACHAIREAIPSDGGLDLWVRTRHHAAWLKDYLTQLRVDADFSEQTARTLLADRWGVTIPDWITDEDILRQNLVGIDVTAAAGGTFAAKLISALLGVDLGAGLPDGRAIAGLIIALTEEAYASVKKRYPILEDAIRRLATKWREESTEEWLADISRYIPENIETVWRLISAFAIISSYPKELLERVLPAGQAALARKIPSAVIEHMPIESGARDEALTQIKLLFAEVAAEVDSQDDFRKIVSWVSGKTAEELQLIESMLGNRRFEPDKDDIRLVREKFDDCTEVRRGRLDALNHLVRPAYPAIVGPDESLGSNEWIQWTAEQYVPYRNWQIQNLIYDKELEETVCHFSDWYVARHTDIQANVDVALVHALNSIAENVHEERLTIILMVDCLPVTFFPVIDRALRTTGFNRHELTYRFAALPTVTEYNKAAIVSGKSGSTEKPYLELLTSRSTRDWGGVAVHYISTLRELSDFDPGGESSVVFVNHIRGDEILHSDVEAENRTYEEELSRSYSQLAEALAEMCERWPGAREHVSVIVLTDHGACRVLEEEGRSFDSTVVSKLFDNEKHRVATMTESQAEKVPENLWNIGYRFTTPFSEDDAVHFLPRGHNTVRKAGRGRGYMHGGVSPEEVIVPVALYGLVAVAWKRPFTRFLHLELSPDEKTARFYIQRVVKIEIEIQNPNSVVLQPQAIELLSPDASVKDVELHDVEPESISVLSIDLYFQKAALAQSSLELKLRYTISGQEYEQLLVKPAEFNSAMSGGFSLKDL